MLLKVNISRIDILLSSVPLLFYIRNRYKNNIMPKITTGVGIFSISCASSILFRSLPTSGKVAVGAGVGTGFAIITSLGLITLGVGLTIISVVGFVYLTMLDFGVQTFYKGHGNYKPWFDSKKKKDESSSNQQ